jgi:single-stranded-DNA-specific exonuclease
VDIAVVLEINEYQGKKSVSYKLKGIRPTGFSDDLYEKSVRFAAKIKNGVPISDEEKVLFKPTRDDFIKVYSKITKNGFSGAIDELAFLTDISYGKIYTAVTAFSELGLITIGKKANNIYIKDNNKQEKVDLESAEIMKRF